MANAEKQKKGFLITFYKSKSGNYKPKSETTAMAKVMRSSWFTKKPKNAGKGEGHGGPRGLEGQERGGGGGDLFQARKSTSEVETNLASVTALLQGKVVEGGGGGAGGGVLDLMFQGGKSVCQFEQGRKSVSHIEQGRKSVSHVEEGRKSVSHVEQGRGWASNVEKNSVSVVDLLQVKVLVSDMPRFMQEHAFRCARRSFDGVDKFSSKHVAYNIKKVGILEWIKDPTAHVKRKKKSHKLLSYFRESCTEI